MAAIEHHSNVRKRRDFHLIVDCVAAGSLEIIAVGSLSLTYRVTRVDLEAMMKSDALEHFKFDFVFLFSRIAFNGYHRLHRKLADRHLWKPFHYKMLEAFHGEH